ncbi:hypothetical protein DICSQDRAFT_75790 [Dichomitus squalens LYAD-421 SS1]|uniref:uncharacterized protein n=1 Tax=Dichomitus squalens (strain LYAD-421) TaxID=732165 RepID=UPI0004411A23|nr:uncharacterized protein DICSQDRAFT_75790 [Dichomitus squalens LYAD-421 SS1]EJF66768.1 hypothetical protein DICSQDRAFT_75790 [Dichomitus squalens LYAD-421 SS1]
MSWLATVVLYLLHALYKLVLAVKSLVARFDRDPLPLVAKRTKIPSHLALNLIPNPEADEETNEKYMLNSVEKVAAWCQATGIRRLTVYDRNGILANSSLDIRKRVMPPAQEEDVDDSPVECDIRYPLTPPPSDDAESRPLSPHSEPSIPKLSVTTIRYPTNSPKAKRRSGVSRTTSKRRRVNRNDEKAGETPLVLHVVSYKSSKPAIAAATDTLLHDFRKTKVAEFVFTTSARLAIQQLHEILEGEYGFPSPDLMIVHRKPPAGQLRSPVEVTGFPPWQMHLTEIHWTTYPRFGTWWTREASEQSSIEEVEFRRALDEYAGAQMRLGK